MPQSLGIEIAFQRFAPRLTRASIVPRPHIGKEKSFWEVGCSICGKVSQLGAGKWTIKLLIPSKPLSGFLLGQPLMCCESAIMVPAIFLETERDVAEALVEVINDSPHDFSERVWTPSRNA